MTNTITIEQANIKVENGKFIIDMDAETLKKMLGIPAVALRTLKAGAEFKLGDDVYIVLEQDGDNTKIISKDFLYTMAFGESNDWRESNIREKLNSEHYGRISAIVGKENIVPMTRDLSAMDGSGSYGTCEDNISMLTFDEYRKYHSILGIEVDYPDWWWLLNPASMRKDYARVVCFVCSNGVPDWNVCVWSCGVRPFCILKSSVLVLENN